MFSFTSLTKIRYAAAVFLLAMPLLLAGQAVAAPATENPPAAKNTRPVAKRPGSLAGQAGNPTALAAAVVAPASPAAPQTVQVTGIVLSPDGRPRAGASVYSAGAPRQLVVTDAQGAFVLPVPAGAAVSLRVEYFGEGTSRIEVPSPGSSVVRVTLGQ